MTTALLSVYDKSGVADLATGLHDLGWRLVSSGGTASCSSARGRRLGRNPPSALRRSCRYFIYGVSSAGLTNAASRTCSSVSFRPKRSRHFSSASSSIFFCWWVMFWPSPASPIP